MADNHVTEQEQVEQLKQWFREYAPSLVFGIFLALSAIYGWRYYQTQQEKKREQAAELFVQMQQAHSAKQTEPYQKTAQRLMDDYKRTPYAALAALTLAQTLVTQKQIPAAIEKIEWALKQSRNHSFKKILRIRLARLYIMQQQWPAAEAALQAVDGMAFMSEKSFLQGQIAQAKGDLIAARNDYQRVLQDKNSPLYDLAKLQFDHLAQPDPKDKA